MESNDEECIDIHHALDVFLVNGITVFTLPNNRPENSIEVRLLVNTGSLMEGEDEQGLAHFVEHLGFKGTRSFEGYKLVKMLESLGISYGPDLNASTHLLETTYKLSIQSDSKLSQLRIAVNILREWAFHMNLSHDDISEEKNVIMSEYIAKQGLGARLLEKYWKCVFDNDSGDRSRLIARRMPIGIPSVFMQADSEQIRRFYSAWYRPENIAILIVGDISNRQDEVHRIVKECFCSVNPTITALDLAGGGGEFATTTADDLIVPDTNSHLNSHSVDTSDVIKSTLPITESYLDTPLFARVQSQLDEHLVLPSHHTSDLAIHLSDKELTSAQISFEFFSPIELSRSLSFVKEDVMHRLMASIVDKRLNEIIKRRAALPGDVVTLPSGDCPWLSVGLSIREFVRGMRCVALNATLNMMHSAQSCAPKSPGPIVAPEGDEHKSNDGILPSADRSESCPCDTRCTQEQFQSTSSPGSSVHDDRWGEVVSCSLRALMVETRRIREWGIHSDELKAAKQKWAQLFVEQRDRNTTTTSSLVSDLTSHVLSGGRTIFAAPAKEASLCLAAIASVTVEDMNSFLSASLDMDIFEEGSRYYEPKSADTTERTRGMFRALSGQFPGVSSAVSSQEADLGLKRALQNARQQVSSLPTVQEWPAPDHVHEDVIIQAAQIALGMRPVDASALSKMEDGTSLSRVAHEQDENSSLVVTDKDMGRGLHFPVVEESVQMCPCCNQSYSFLPTNILRRSGTAQKKMTCGRSTEKVPNDVASMVLEEEKYKELTPLGVVQPTKNLSLSTSSNSSISGAESSHLPVDSALPRETIVNRLPSTDSYEFRLANGITVCVKWMPEDSPGKISFQGFALGGSTELTESEDVAMSFLDTMASQSCMRVPRTGQGYDGKSTAVPSTQLDGADGDNGNIVLKAKDIAEIQSVAKVGVNTQRHFNHRGIGGSGPVEKLELLLSLLALKLTSQCIDEKAFDDTVKQQRNFLMYRNNSPEQIFLERARILTCGDEPVARPLSEEALSNCTVDMARQLYARAFLLDPTDFTFVFIGDLPALPEVQRLFALYLGSLRPLPPPIASTFGGKWGQCQQQQKQQPIDNLPIANSIQYKKDLDDSSFSVAEEEKPYPFTLLGRSFRITEPIQETVRLRQADNASSLLVFRVELRNEESVMAEERDLKNTIALDAACKCLQSALLDELRIRLGKVYSVVVHVSRGSLSHIALISVSLLCDPSHIDQLRQSIEQQLAQVHKKGPDANVLSGIVESMCSKHMQSLKSPSHWMFWILDSYKSYKVYAWVNAHASQQPEKLNDISVVGDRPAMMCSSTWVDKFAAMRSVGKCDAIRDVVRMDVLHNVYKKFFDLNKSVHLNLCPVEEKCTLGI